ncbi:hypothetical protein [Absidia glauca]|uniref:Uncharacterized protein n=1 Tax=Absidia glauca TaxID=4829 RepID=A0A168MIP0_ABSGL|nr:hypothetical protein [Absidia glauca]
MESPLTEFGDDYWNSGFADRPRSDKWAFCIAFDVVLEDSDGTTTTLTNKVFADQESTLVEMRAIAHPLGQIWSISIPRYISRLSYMPIPSGHKIPLPIEGIPSHDHLLLVGADQILTVIEHEIGQKIQPRSVVVFLHWTPATSMIGPISSTKNSCTSFDKGTPKNRQGCSPGNTYTLHMHTVGVFGLQSLEIHLAAEMSLSENMKVGWIPPRRIALKNAVNAGILQFRSDVESTRKSSTIDVGNHTKKLTTCDKLNRRGTP